MTVRFKSSADIERLDLRPRYATSRFNHVVKQTAPDQLSPPGCLREPVAGRRRPNRMFADTKAVRSFGRANSAHAEALSVIAATLSSLPTGAAATVMGPVAAGFIAALAEAAARE